MCIRPRHFLSFVLLALGICATPLGISATEPIVGAQMQRMLGEAALLLLKEGNARFANDPPQHPLLNAEQRLARAREGESPIATILACADSRVPVELIFDRGIGELFTIRIAGNVADTDQIASIEYSVSHLHTPLVIVLGHTHCDAVTAVASGRALPGLLPQLLDNVKPALARARARSGTTNQTDLVARTIEENVWQAMADTVRRSSLIREELRQQRARMLGAIYDLESGKVRWLGEHPALKAILGATPTDGTPGSPAPPWDAVPSHADAFGSASADVAKALNAALPNIVGNEFGIGLISTSPPPRSVETPQSR